jgi:hypothetical protein
MKTLAEKYPEAIERFKQVGLVHLAELCGRHYRQIDMAVQIGHPSSLSKWLTLEHLPSRQVEERARQALEEQRLNQKTLDLPEPVPAPAPAPAAQESTMLMVFCPPGSEEKVQRVLAMLRCEVEVV